MRRVSHFAVATMLTLAGVASAAENVVTKVTARADGGKTVDRRAWLGDAELHGLSAGAAGARGGRRGRRQGGRRGAARRGRSTSIPGRSGRSRWRSTQSDVSRTARVMIGFKRPSSYDVKAVGHDLVITVTPDEPMPAGGSVAAGDGRGAARGRGQDGRGAQAARRGRGADAGDGAAAGGGGERRARRRWRGPTMRSARRTRPRRARRRPRTSSIG